MSVPTPAKSIDGHCSAINDDILYVLSSDSLQALPLKENATWASLPLGVPVVGPACVTAVSDSDASDNALYVVGGTSTSDGYAGLQRYFFANQTWQTLTPLDVNLRNRTDHGAAYLNDSASILVYAGSQPDAVSDLSSQTFLISTVSPYNIQSYTSKAPPTNQPILLPYDDAQAVMVGGDASNTQVWLFNPSDGWAAFNTTLDAGLNAGVRGTIVDGSDGSRVLETYDMTVSPNKVTQTVLLDAGGTIAAPGQSLGSSTRKRKRNLSRRELTLSNWPSYNSSMAPSVKRADYAVAQASNGLAVMTGGDSTSPLDIFNTDKNAWVDSGLFFTGDANNNQVALTTSGAISTPSSTASSTASSAAASSSAADSITGGSASKAHMLKVLGITLGVLVGVAAAFIIALLCIRARKQRRKREHDYINEKADRMDFQDRGASFMKEAGGSVVELSDPSNSRFGPPNSHSHSSLAIMGGRFSRHSRNVGAKGSTDSTRQLVRPKSNIINISAPLELGEMNESSRPAMIAREENSPRNLHAEPVSTALANKKRSSGWSRYFATTPSEPQLPSAYDPHSAYPSTTPSNYTVDSRMSDVPSMPDRVPSGIFVAPLKLDFGNQSEDRQRLSRVATGSPSFAHSHEDLAARGGSLDVARGQTARIHSYNGSDGESMSYDAGSTRTHSVASSHLSSSDYYNNESSESAWTPVSLQAKQREVADTSNPTHAPRPPSSNYTASVYGERMMSARGASSTFFPGSGVRDIYRPTSRIRSPIMPAPLSVPGRDSLAADQPRQSTLSVFPRGVLSNRSTFLQVTPPSHNPNVTDSSLAAQRSNDVRESNLTVFPTDFPSARSPTELAPPPVPSGNANLPDDIRETRLTVFPTDFPSVRSPIGLQPPPVPKSSAVAQDTAEQDHRMTVMTTFPTDFPSPRGQQFLAPPRSPLAPRDINQAPSAPAQDRKFNMTTFPHDFPSPSHVGQSALVPIDSHVATHPGSNNRSTIKSNLTTFPSDFPSPTTVQTEVYALPASSWAVNVASHAPDAFNHDSDHAAEDTGLDGLRTAHITVFPTDFPAIKSPTGVYLVAPRSPLDGVADQSAHMQMNGPDDRASTATAATLFPRGANSAYYAARKSTAAREHEREIPAEDRDMSWLNLGLGGRV